MQIFEYLIGYRKQKKVTLKKLGEEFEKQPETLSKYEKGIVPVPGYIVEKYAEHFDFEIKLQLK